MKNSDPAESGSEPELAEADWDTLAECLERFSAAWEGNPAREGTPQTGNVSARVSGDQPGPAEQPPPLKPFLPDDGGEALRNIALVELIKLDMEYRSRDREHWKPLEEYQREWPDSGIARQVPADLVYEEYHLKKRIEGDTPASGYRQRFPGSFDSLTRLIREDTRKSTAWYRPGQVDSFDVGDRVDDFDLLTRLGKGAFATVFLARQNSMQRLVALKISADQGREPQMLAQLDHPHIVRVYDQRVIDIPRVRLMYMQYVAGGTLQEVFAEARQLAGASRLAGPHLVAALDRLLNRRGESIPVKSENRRRLARSSWTQVVSQTGNEIAQALSCAHERNVLHRDLKPANVLLDKDGHVRLVDFNISFCSKLDGATPAAYFGGSLAYMSPEQLEACSPDHDRQPAELDGRSDIFSVGVVLFELLAGERPFADEVVPGDWSGTTRQMIEVRRQGISDEARRKLKPAAPILDKAISRCLSGAPDDRFADGAALQRNLAWAGNPRSGVLFRARKHPLSRFANATPFLTAGTLTLGMSAAAVLFILAYNTEKSVPADARSFFRTVVNYQNILLFTLGGVLIFRLTRPVSRCLNRYRRGVTLSPEEVERAIARNLNLGHYVSLMSVTEWTLGGALLPTILVLSGTDLPVKAIFDFISSHFLAGAITAAYVFWTITFCSLHVWQPRLLEAALDYDADLDLTDAHYRLEKRYGFYHLLAISVPLAGIAWLVLYEGSAAGSLQAGSVDQRSLATLCIVALLGLILLVWTARRVRYWLDVQKSFNPPPKDFF